MPEEHQIMADNISLPGLQKGVEKGVDPIFAIKDEKT
jgi:hypothetical protein